MKIVLIAALSEDGTIGDKGRIPWHISADLKRFKQTTMGHPVIMGRKTFESIGKPLPGRVNIVLTHNPAFRPAGALVFPDLSEALGYLGTVNSKTVFVIGGAELYRAALPLADALYLTHVHMKVHGDTKFPAFDRNEWVETSRQEFADHSYVQYARRHHIPRHV